MTTDVTVGKLARTAVVLALAAELKLYYSATSVDGLLWILAPTTFCVELITGTPFTFEQHAGYMSDDHSFLIAAPCSGVNFLIISFLVLAIGRLWRAPGEEMRWTWVPALAVTAFAATIVANTVRIAVALEFRESAASIGWLSPDQMHRLEGIVIYFGSLLILFVVSEMRPALRSASDSPLIRRSLLPLLIYYAVTVGVPVLNGAYRQGSYLNEHLVFVLVTPLVVVLPVAGFWFVMRPYRRIF